ncbi:MAG: hypothetical protein AB7E72_16115 [Lysobacterales bacterium]
MNQHLITYAEYLEICAFRIDSDLKYVDRGFGAARSQAHQEYAFLADKAKRLRLAARTPEQIIADEAAEKRRAEYIAGGRARHEARLDEIFVDAAFPLFERMKLEGLGTPQFFAAKYHRHLPALEAMFKEKHKEAA